MHALRPPNPLGLTGALVLGALVLVAGAVVACRSLGTGPHGRAPTSCADCHRAIARQWRASEHARAWTGEAFAAESKQRTKPECLPCHAPQPLLEQERDRKPLLREERRADGVDCSACHTIGCAQAGPCNLKAPHPTVHDEGRLRASAFCGRCHEHEFTQYKKLYLPAHGQAEQKTCAQCHMPAYVARLTQGHLLSKAHPRRVVRDHSFCGWTPALLRNVLRVSAWQTTRADDGDVQVSFALINEGAGHRIPTGKNGYRELRIRVQVLDEAGGELAMDEESLLGDGEDGLAPGEERVFEFALDVRGEAQPTHVRLLVERVNEDESFRVVLLRIDRDLYR